MNTLLQYSFFLLVVKPLTYFVLGLNVRHHHRCPKSGPAILIANHNSHLDTIVLMTLFPFRLLKRIRPVAAMDYFLKNRLLAWFALKIMGIIPINRKVTKCKEDLLAGCSQALERGETLILFPEGTRGEPEQLASFKTGVAHLAKRHSNVPVVPVFMHGLGKALPKGESVLVPFLCDVVIGEHLFWTDSRADFMDKLESSMKGLAAQVNCPPWK